MSIILFICAVLAFVSGADDLHNHDEAGSSVKGLISAAFFIGALMASFISAQRRKIEQTILSAKSPVPPTKPIEESKSPEPIKPIAPSKSPDFVQPTPYHIYFFSIAAVDLGPHTLQEMKRLVAAAQIDAETLVFRDGDTNWKPLNQFQELISN